MTIKHSPGCRCCKAKCAVCVGVFLCDLSVEGLGGYSVSLTQGETTYGPCDPSGDGTCCFDVPSGDYTIVATGPCGTATKDITVACPEGLLTTIDVPGGTISVTQTGGLCDAILFTGAITGPGGFTGMVPASPDAEICVPFPGDYTIDWVSGEPCFPAMAPPSSVTVSDCGGSASIGVTPTTVTITITILGCCSLPLPGASYSIGGAGGPISGTTGPSGTFTANLIAGCDYSLSASKSPYFPLKTISFTAPCTDDSIVLQLDPIENLSDTHICTCCCADPIPKSLKVTSAAGDCLVAWTPGPGDGGYIGCQTWDGQDVLCMGGIGEAGIVPCGEDGGEGPIAIVWEFVPCGTLIQRWSCCFDEISGIRSATAGTCIGTFPFLAVRDTNVDGCATGDIFHDDPACSDTATVAAEAACGPFHLVCTFDSGPPVSVATITES